MRKRQAPPPFLHLSKFNSPTIAERLSVLAATVLVGIIAISKKSAHAEMQPNVKTLLSSLIVVCFFFAFYARSSRISFVSRTSFFSIFTLISHDFCDSGSVFFNINSSKPSGKRENRKKLAHEHSSYH